MKINFIYIFLFSLMLMACEEESLPSYNPFAPNYNISSATLERQGFEYSGSCNGTIFYEKQVGEMEITNYINADTQFVEYEEYRITFDTCENNPKMDFYSDSLRINQILRKYKVKLLLDSLKTGDNYYTFLVKNLSSNKVFKCFMHFEEEKNIKILGFGNSHPKKQRPWYEQIINNLSTIISPR